MKKLILLLIAFLTTTMTSPAFAAMPSTAAVNTTVNTATTVTTIKKALPELDKTVYIILSVLGLGWLAMGLNDDFEGSDWLIALLLGLLFVIPGMIYALVKMKKYYR